MYAKHNNDRVCQGSLIENFPVEFKTVEDSQLIILRATFPYLIVLSQDCDLEQHHASFQNSERKDDGKILETFLVCPAYLSSEFKAGTHLNELNKNMEKWGGDLWKQIQNNLHPRFHFLKTKQEFGVPELVADFKHYYTINYLEFQKSQSTINIRLDILFREDVSLRFANYISRIGLPNN